MKRLIARLALVVGIATAAVFFTAGGGSGVEAAAYPYCGPATGPCYGYAGYPGYTGYPYAGYTGLYNYNYVAYRPAYVPAYNNVYVFGTNGCALGNYTCLRAVGVPYVYYP
jgi:hypothetical protein